MTASGSPSDYEVVVDPELPPDGVWGSPFFAYDRSGRPAPDTAARQGTAVVVLVRRADGTEWVASFPPGAGGVDGVHRTPSADHLCVLASGTAHVVRTSAPARGAPVVLESVQQVTESVDPPLLLLVGDLGLAALGPEGLAWHADPWCALDDIRVRRADAAGIRCTGTAWGGTEIEFTVDPVTGQVIEPPPPPPWAPVTTAARAGRRGRRRLRWWR